MTRISLCPWGCFRLMHNLNKTKLIKVKVISYLSPLPMVTAASLFCNSAIHSYSPPPSSVLQSCSVFLDLETTLVVKWLVWVAGLMTLHRHSLPKKDKPPQLLLRRATVCLIFIINIFSLEIKKNKENKAIFSHGAPATWNNLQNVMKRNSLLSLGQFKLRLFQSVVVFTLLQLIVA